MEFDSGFFSIRDRKGKEERKGLSMKGGRRKKEEEERTKENIKKENDGRKKEIDYK